MSCCGNSNVPARTLVPASSFSCSVPGDVCAEPMCSSWTDPRLAGAPPAASLSLLGRIGQSYYVLATDKNGFVVCKDGRHKVSAAPDVGLPYLRKFVPATDGSSNIQATPEGVPIEDFPPTATGLHIQGPRGNWYAWRGPTDQEADVFWNGYDFEFKAPDTGKVKGPLEIVDEIVIMGTESQAGCDNYEDIKKLNPRAGFLIGDGRKHTTLSCGDVRTAPEDLEVYGILACTSKGPGIIHMPETGILIMCNGKLVGLEPPRWTAQDQADGKIPSGKTVNDFIEGMTLKTDANGCLGFSISPITSSGPQPARYLYTNTVQYYTVPASVTRVSIKCWGAGGSSRFIPRGGVGGFTQGVFPVTPGDVLIVIVGESPIYDGGIGPRQPVVAGWGGLGSPDNLQEPGGGLAGVFTGAGIPSASDSARALIIAGGGGAARATSLNDAGTYGENGNAATSGGEATMMGAEAIGGAGGVGAGGGGYRGGGQGRGGSGFLHSSKISGNILASPDQTIPGSSDVDYLAPFGQSNGGHGLVVITPM